MKDQGLSKSQLAVMTVAAGVCVANIYYNQPILKDIAAGFGLKAGNVGLISVLSQAGYGLGLFFLFDKLENKAWRVLVRQGAILVNDKKFKNC